MIAAAAGAEERGSLWSSTCSGRRVAIAIRVDRLDSYHLAPPTDCDGSSTLLRLFVVSETEKNLILVDD